MTVDAIGRVALAAGLTLALAGLPLPARSQAASNPAASPAAAPSVAVTSAEDSGVGARKPRLLLVPESSVNNAAAQQYAQMLRQAQSRGALNGNAAQVRRVREITARLVPLGVRFNPAAARWRWEVNVIDAQQINAFCMPGGKIVVFAGLIDRLKLSDDELAAVIGHEIAHALLEHGRARMSEQVLKSVGLNLAAAYFGLSDASAVLLGQAVQVAITLPYSRGHETDADLVGLELSARAGFDPRAAVTLWRKMAAASAGQPPQFLSTHPGHAQRIGAIERALPAVLPLYERAARGR
jgi:Zn-dependent protease with chaperone function